MATSNTKKLQDFLSEGSSERLLKSIFANGKDEVKSMLRGKGSASDFENTLKGMGVNMKVSDSEYQKMMDDKTYKGTRPDTSNLPPVVVTPELEQELQYTIANNKNKGNTSSGTGTASKEYSYSPYQESDIVKQAQAQRDAVLSNKPSDYQSALQSDIRNAMEAYLNRDRFSYDMNADPLYNQYKDAFIQQGQMAMMDTMGQAAALTGGYGSSYASIAGNQAYQQSLQKLNDIVPELQQNAYEMYRQEGQDMLNRYSLLADQESQEYARYRDSLADWNAERSYQDSRYDAERDYEYNKYLADKTFDYNAYRDAVADAQWRESFDYSKDRDALADSQWRESFEYGKTRDEVADKQWQDSFEYGQYRDSVSDKQWQDSFEYGQYRDEVADKQYKEQFEYGKDRDKVADKQYKEQFEYGKERDKVADSQWNKNYEINREQADIYKERWEMEKEQFDKAVEGGDTTGALKHISSMSPEEILSTAQAYGEEGDNEGLRNFLFYCVNAGMMTTEMMDAYYNSYRSSEVGEEEEEESFAPAMGYNGFMPWNDWNKWRK